MAFAVNQNWTWYFLEGICSENWTSCLNKRTRCFVDWIMRHPTEDLSAKKPPKNPLNVIYIHKNGANSNVPSSKYYKLSFIRSFLILICIIFSKFSKCNSFNITIFWKKTIYGYWYIIANLTTLRKGSSCRCLLTL